MFLISSNVLNLQELEKNPENPENPIIIKDLATRLTYFENLIIEDPDFDEIPQIIKGVLDEVKIELNNRSVNILARSVDSNYIEINKLLTKVFNKSIEFGSKHLTSKDCEDLLCN